MGMQATEANPSGIESRRTPLNRLTKIDSMPLVCGAGLCAALTLLTACTGRIPLSAATTIAALVPAVVVDMREHRLPNRLVGAAAALGTACFLIAAAVGSTLDISGELVSAGVGSLMMSVPLLALHLVSPSAMGFGDVKAAAVLGAGLGLVAPLFALVALVIASATTAVVGVVMRRSAMPFGPGLVGGAMIALAVAAAPIAIVDDLTTSRPGASSVVLEPEVAR
jgi:leader peptidase (prepilin peptidase) / N-methyltransferase